MLAKSILDVSYEDIKQLMVAKVEESDILDYKEELGSGESILKHVCAFANTYGGDLVFGIKESGDGGHPVEIIGMNIDDIQKERIENIILANITPRLDVKIKQIPIPDKEKSILVIRIPDSHTRPHCVKDKGYYKRFNFKSEPMTEREIADLYKKRFSNYEYVNQYIENLLVGYDSSAIIANIVVIPINIEHRLVNTFDYEKFRWIEDIKLKSYRWDYQTSIVPCFPTPFSHGLYDMKSLDPTSPRISIHRNGCVHYTKNFRKSISSEYSLNLLDLSIRTMEILEFAVTILHHYNYFGEVRVVVTLTGPSGTKLESLEILKINQNKLDAKIERELPLDYIEQNYESVTASIMHEIANHYEVPNCRYFDDNDKWNPPNQR